MRVENSTTTWAEVRAKIGDTLPDFMGEEARWSTPMSVEFWECIYDPDEIRLYFMDQARKYILINDDVAYLYGRAAAFGYDHNLLALYREGLINYVREHIDQLIHVFELLATDPLINAFIEFLSLSKGEGKKRIEDLVKEGKLDTISDGAKVVVWWIIFSNNPSRELLHLVVEHGVKPPEIL